MNEARKVESAESRTQRAWRMAHGEEHVAQSAESMAHGEERITHGAWRRALGVWQEIPYALCPMHHALNAIVVPDEDEDVLVDDDIGIRIDAPWKVVLYNDEIHTFDEVILQLQKAIGCSAQRAEKIAFEAHHRGKAVAYSGEFNECFRVMGVLREIQLVVEIEG